MELGGNANAKAFFRDHGVSDLKTESKYQTRAAELYKHKLKELTDDTKKKKYYFTSLYVLILTRDHL